ncbi:hypothetical protein BDN71DRAFT_1452243 [Pleurotus eryngii]|uniref:Uncharacterized protein n=1 Tax=Pleurotus eryngii TaxID=5323 RepID=A0A9P6DDH6_PLEER|nr:hypothetical protein BDN71DRAFT_1452243 [Pleurotus eryngii]
MNSSDVAFRTLNSTIVATGFASDGSPATGQVPSLTSTNNFINFCLTYPQLPNTNGSESLEESCNSAPMGAIPSIQNIPSLKIVSPKHGDTVQANTDLQLSFVVQNMQVGAPTDDGVNFLSAPQQLNKRGVIIGYPIIIIEKLPSLTAAQPGNAKIFAFSKTVIDPPVNGISQDLIRMGLPPGVYRISVQLRAVNRQPILVSTPEHGALGDMVYITAEGANNDSDAFGSSVSPTVGNSIISAAVNTQDSSQSSLILDPKVISSAFASAGKGASPGITGSLTSSNNFINYCLSLEDTQLTNGEIVLAGSCNPVPMGVLPDVDHMPSSKFTYPKNGDNIPAGKTFTISLAVNNLQTGSLANPQKSFLAAPQQVNAQGLIIGHAKVVIEALTGFNQTSPTDPTKFAFFEHIGSQAQGGILTASVNKGLPDGYYRLSSMLSATNSQPIVVPLLQPGIEDDTVYFTVGDPAKATATTTDGGGSGSNGSGKGGNESSPTATPFRPSRSTGKAAIIGGVLGCVLGAIVICALVYIIIRRRRSHSMDLDTEVAQVSVTPFEQPASSSTTREKPLPAGPSSTVSPPDQEFQMAGPSSATSDIRHHGIHESPKSDTETNPPPYQP